MPVATALLGWGTEFALGTPLSHSHLAHLCCPVCIRCVPRGPLHTATSCPQLRLIHSLLGIFPGCLASPLGHQALGKTHPLFFPKSYCTVKDHREPSGSEVPRGVLELGPVVSPSQTLTVLHTAPARSGMKAFGGPTGGRSVSTSPQTGMTVVGCSVGASGINGAVCITQETLRLLRPAELAPQPSGVCLCAVRVGIAPLVPGSCSLVTLLPRGEAASDPP